jgi:RNA polymerase sigma factor (sigma-70 family)
MRNSRESAAAGAGEPPKSSLTDAQVDAFWKSVLKHQDAARSMAGRYLSKQNAEDAVTTAAILFLEDLQRSRKPARYPKTDGDFRRQFLAIVRNHSIDCVRPAKKEKRPDHAFWGLETEPFVGGRKVADKPLDRIFARNDTGDYDAPAVPETRDQDTTDMLDQILRCHLAELPRMQREVIKQTFLEKRKRAEVAARLGIRVKTYDSHLQAAYATLRHLLAKDADTFTAVNRTVWYDLIEELRERYEESHVRRLSARSVERSNPKGEASNPEGEGDNPARAGAA